MKWKKALYFTEGTIVAVLAFFYLHPLLPFATFSIFQARDLARAEAFASGVPILFGPEMSGGGNLPGGFYYFLLSLPFRLGMDWTGSWSLLVLQNAISLGVLWIYFRKHFGLLSATCCLFFIKPSLNFINPSYLSLVVSLALIFLCEAFNNSVHISERRRAASWVGFCLLCGLASQIHFTGIFLLVAGALIQVLALPMFLPRLSVRRFVLGLFVFACTLIPFFYWLVAGENGPFEFQASLPHTGKRLISWSYLLAQTRNNFHSNPAGVYLARIFTLFPPRFLAAICVALAISHFGKGESKTPDFASNCRKVILVVVVVLLGQCIFFVISPNFGRYLLGYSVAFLFLTAALLGELGGKMSQLTYRMAVAGMFLASAVLLGAGAKPPANRDSSLTIQESLEISQVVFARTGWSHSEAMARLYFLNVHNEVSLRYPYLETTRRNREMVTVGAREGTRSTFREVGGFFVLLIGRHPGAARLPARKILLQSHPEKTLIAAIETGALKLEDPITVGRVILIPYTATDLQRTPSYFHNRGEGYFELSPQFEKPLAQGAVETTVSFNECPGREPFCEIKAAVRIGPERRGTWEAQVLLSGHTISQSSDWISPDWTQALVRPFLSYECNGEKQKFQLAESVGFNNLIMQATQNNSFLAPFERRFRISCAGQLTNVGIGYETSVSYGKGSSQKLPSRFFLVR